jgi:putative transposase
MFSLILTMIRSLRCAFMPRRDLVLENLALRHQLLVLNRRHEQPHFHRADRLLWVALRAVWSRWTKALVIVQPQTVVRWHRAGFRLYWRWRSRQPDGRPPIDRKLLELIRQIWTANPTWGSPRIRDELAKLGLHVSDSTIRKYRPKAARPSSQTWKTFLRNHAAQIVAVDFFTVPTVIFRVLFVFVILAHERRRIRHIAITEAPSAGWTAQQVVEAFAFEPASKYLLRDRDGIYGTAFVDRVSGLGTKEKLIAPRSPWQSPYVERLIGSFRRECLDHFIILNEPHLKAVLAEYLEYYHGARTHLALERDCPVPRPVEKVDLGEVVAMPMVGGLHHRYTRRAA